MKNLYLLVIISCVCLGTSCSSTRKTAGVPGNGFVNLLGDTSLKDWEYDNTYWRMENGVLVGEVTPQTILKRNSFIIWNGGQPGDFELKAEYRVSALGNSGINYRSIKIDSLPFALKGYQADLDGRNRYSGQNYEERGRQFLARRGQRVVLEQGQPPKLIDTLGTEEYLSNVIKKEDWNEYHLVVKGNNMKHYINGVLLSEVTDNDAAERKMNGYIGVQVHVGPPMKIEYRNFRLKVVK